MYSVVRRLIEVILYIMYLRSSVTVVTKTNHIIKFGFCLNKYLLGFENVVFGFVNKDVQGPHFGLLYRTEDCTLFKKHILSKKQNKIKNKEYDVSSLQQANSKFVAFVIETCFTATDPTCFLYIYHVLKPKTH